MPPATRNTTIVSGVDVDNTQPSVDAGWRRRHGASVRGSLDLTGSSANGLARVVQSVLFGRRLGSSGGYHRHRRRGHLVPVRRDLEHRDGPRSTATYRLPARWSPTRPATRAGPSLHVLIDNTAPTTPGGADRGARPSRPRRRSASPPRRSRRLSGSTATTCTARGTVAPIGTASPAGGGLFTFSRFHSPPRAPIRTPSWPSTMRATPRRTRRMSRSSSTRTDSPLRRV